MRTYSSAIFWLPPTDAILYLTQYIHNMNEEHKKNAGMQSSTNHRTDAGDSRTDSGHDVPRRTHRQPRFEKKQDSRKPAKDRPGKSVPKADRNAESSQVRSRDSKPDNKPARSPRLQKNPRELVVETLIKLENGGYSNIVWDLAIRHSALNNLDKILATRIFYGTLSNIRLIDALWNDIEPEMLKRADTVVKMALRSAMYQLVFLDRVPAYSIVSTTVDVVKHLRNHAACGYCNALLRKAVARQEAGRLKYNPTGNELTDFAVKYSMNDDLASLIIGEFGEQAAEIAESMLSVPRMVLRVNQSKVSMQALRERENFDVEPSSLFPKSSCVVVKRHEAIEKALDDGEVCVQDDAAQMAVMALGTPETWAPGRDEVHLWDACAGHGGKSIYLLDEIACDKSQRRFQLLSTDLFATKLERLQEYHQKHFPAQKLIAKARDLTIGGSVPLAPFDVILVDAPCSGLGVLRRHPEVKLLRKAEDIASLVELQHQILDNVCRHLRVGGILVYAVCTITQAECEQQVESFLQQHPNFERRNLPAECTSGRGDCAQIKLLPHTDGCDGFFVARFTRVS